MDIEQRKNEAFRKGVVIFILLATLTVGEYFIGAVAHVWWAPLLTVALIKAYLIVRDYMHVGRLFAGDEEVHS